VTRANSPHRVPELRFDPQPISVFLIVFQRMAGRMRDEIVRATPRFLLAIYGHPDGARLMRARDQRILAISSVALRGAETKRETCALVPRVDETPPVEGQLVLL
jgi:hypothetical protein